MGRRAGGHLCVRADVCVFVGRQCMGMLVRACMSTQVHVHADDYVSAVPNTRLLLHSRVSLMAAWLSQHRPLIVVSAERHWNFALRLVTQPMHGCAYVCPCIQVCMHVCMWACGGV